MERWSAIDPSVYRDGSLKSVRGTCKGAARLGSLKSKVMMNGRGEFLIESLRKVRMELRTVREELGALRKCVEEIAARMREGSIGTREESEAREGKEKNEREEGRSTEVDRKEGGRAKIEGGEEK